MTDGSAARSASVRIELSKSWRDCSGRGARGGGVSAAGQRSASMICECEDRKTHYRSQPTFAFHFCRHQKANTRVLAPLSTLVANINIELRSHTDMIKDGRQIQRTALRVVKETAGRGDMRRAKSKDSEFAIAHHHGQPQMDAAEEAGAT